MQLARRIITLLLFLALDIVLIRLALRDEPALVQRVQELSNLPIETLEPTLSPSPTPLLTPSAVTLLAPDWTGSTLRAGLRNTFSSSVSGMLIRVETSLVSSPFVPSATHEVRIPSPIGPGETLYFAAPLPTPQRELWWRAEILEVNHWDGATVQKLPPGVRVSTNPIRLATPTPDPRAWGVAKQVDDVTWTIRVADDPRMGTESEIFAALNSYRQTHGKSTLSLDDRLTTFAKERAATLAKLKSTDKHAGFLEYIKSEDNVRALGFASLGENSGYGHKLYGVHLIEWIYAADEGHNTNQLSSDWSHVGIGVDGVALVFIFGGNKL